MGVARSLTGRRWVLRPALDRQVEALAQALDLPQALARVLVGRGVDLEAAPGFLNPQLKSLLPDPFGLKDMDKAAQALADAVAARSPILLFGDYDVDGATSAALMARYLRGLGAQARIHIPDRLGEGYGPTPQAMRSFKADGAGLVVTLDCGIAAHDALEEAQRLDLPVLVLDHHKAPDRLPPALALVNPNRLDEADDAPRMLAAVGVTFLAAVALRAELRRRGALPADGGPDLLTLLDLVALGTVCDMVPLTGPNRALVAQGLKVMAGRRNVGLAALADVARADGPPTCYHLGFLMGPRINAGGRLGQSGLGAQLLSCVSADEARQLAADLDRLNADRRAVEQAVYEAAAAVAALSDDGPLAFVHGPDWHPGVLGIVAGRLKESLGRPALVLGRDDGGRWIGSARSIPGVDFGAAVIDAAAEGLVIKGGGHAMAAGLTVADDRLAALNAFLCERLAKPVAAAQSARTLALDGALSGRAATVELADALDQAGPYGIGHPGPRFALPRMTLRDARVVGGSHVKLRVTGGDGAPVNAIAFRAADTDLGRALLDGRAAAWHLAGQLKLSHYAGRITADFHLEDAAPAG